MTTTSPAARRPYEPFTTADLKAAKPADPSPRQAEPKQHEQAKPSRRRQPVRVPATDRQPASVRVPLNAAGDFATVDADDFDRLMAQGVSDQWFLNDNGRGRPYVCVAHGPRLHSTVGRLVMDALPGQSVRVRNGNTLDLRRHNLKRVGKAKQVSDYLERHPEHA